MHSILMYFDWGEHPLQEPDSPLYLLDQAMPWLTTKNRPRRAAVSAFGFGGTNFHAVLEEYMGEYRPLLHTASSQRWPSELLLWHGVDREDLKVKLTRVLQEFEKITNRELHVLGYNLATGYRTGGETIAIVATDIGDLRNKIRSVLSYLAREITTLSTGVYHSGSAERDGKVAILFPGQGSQYTGMSCELALNFPVYAETLSEADQLLSECFARRFGGGIRLSHFIFPRGSYSEQAKADAIRALTSTDVAQPALGAIGAGLWKLMRSFGLEPHMLGGHSYGEFIALFAGKVIDFDTLMLLSEARGRFIVDTVKNAGTELGTMVAIQASRHYVEKIISDIDDVVVANHNAPQQCVISGSTAAIKEALEKMSQNGAIVSKISVAAAFHSRFVETAQSALADLIEKTVWQNAKIPVYSNTTGEPHAHDAEKVKQVMINHLVRPVEFLTQIEAMYRDGARVFLELGPKTVLTKLINSILEGRSHKAIAIDGNGGGITGMLHAFGQLICAGIKLDVTKLFEGRGCFSGDPVHLVRMQRSEPDIKQIWLLNGSRARRATEPVKQIGIRMEEINSLSAGLSGSKEQLLSRPGNNSIDTSKLMSRKHRKEEPQMGGCRQVPIAGGSAVMAEHFNMMRQFLETHERIMAMYMGVASNDRRTGQRLSRHIQFQKNYEDLRPENDQSTLKTKLPLQPEEPAGVSAKTSAEADVQKTPAATSAQLEKVSAKARLVNRPTERIDRGKMTDILLSIIEEKTGYPPDMVGLAQNLEADLGIDSIKRVEIVSALLKALPPCYGQEFGKDLGGLNTQPTLNGMLDILDEIKVGGSVPVPFDQAEMGSTTYGTSHSFRHVIKPKHEPIGEFALRRLGQGHFIITQDTLGVAEKLSELLRAHDCTVSIVKRDILKDENSLNQWCLSLKADIDAIAGIVHLAQIGSDWFTTDAPTQTWRSQLQLNEKSLFILLHNLNGKLRDDAHVFSVSALGGVFNRNDNNVSALSLQGGAVGLLKSLREECPNIRVKAIDIDSEQRADSIALCLIGELELVGGRQEVGYPAGRRTIFQTVPESLSQEEACSDVVRDLVVLATGGVGE